MKSVYLDHNATSPLRAEARAALLHALDRVQGNPSSVHTSGRSARMLLDEARERVAGALGVQEEEILFTSGGTEADNLALMGGMGGLGPGASLVTSPVEHAAVLTAAKELQHRGCEVQYARVDRAARLDTEHLLDVLTGGGMLALMAANSEVGTVYDLSAVNEGMQERFADRKPLFFTDAVQALGRIPIDLVGWGVDLAAFSAHKIGGPMGIGVLYRRAGTALEPRLFGGGQEGGLRAGTENVAGIYSASIAIELAVQEQGNFAERSLELTCQLWQQLVENVVDIRINGPQVHEPDRLPNTLNVRLNGVEGQVLVTKLDLLGLQASAGSACASGSVEPSPVLRAMGFNDADARSGLRLSLGRDTNEKDINTAVEILSKTTRAARNS